MLYDKNLVFIILIVMRNILVEVNIYFLFIVLDGLVMVNVFIIVGF